MSITAIRGSVQVSLTDGNPYWLEAYTGIGMAPLHVLTQRGSEQHGATRVGFRLDPRTFNLVIASSALTDAIRQQYRDDLIMLFSPFGEPLVLRWVLPDGAVRQIDPILSADCDMPSADKDGFMQRVGLELYSDDPTFYDPTQLTQVFDLGGSTGAGEVPSPVPTAIGVSTLDEQHVIAYTGSAPSYPIIRVVGPITDCVITNESTGMTLDFTGTTINEGDFYEIDCRYRYQSVTDAAGANRVGYLTDASDLGLFCLAPEPEVPLGHNTIHVTGDAINNVTSITVSYFLRYLGI